MRRSSAFIASICSGSKRPPPRGNMLMRAGSAARAMTTLCGSNPRSKVTSATKLRKSNPAAVRSTWPVARASAPPGRWPAQPVRCSRAGARIRRPPARDPAREQQSGHVGARHQQHQAGGYGQHPGAPVGTGGRALRATSSRGSRARRPAADAAHLRHGRGSCAPRSRPAPATPQGRRRPILLNAPSKTIPPSTGSGSGSTTRSVQSSVLSVGNSKPSERTPTTT